MAILQEIYGELPDLVDEHVAGAMRRRAAAAGMPRKFIDGIKVKRPRPDQI